MLKNSFVSLSDRFLGSMSLWRLATIFAACTFFGLSVRWICLDNSPPMWDPGYYLYQATFWHNTLMQNGVFQFIVSIFNLDRGRVPLLPVIVQPAFYFFGPGFDIAVITVNCAWFIIAWAVSGIARDLTEPHLGDKAGFFAFVLFGLYPLTTVLSHDLFVEFLLVTFVCAAIYSLWLLYKTGEKKWSVISGIFIALGLLTKVTFPAFVLPAFLILFYLNTRKSTVWKTLLLFFPAMLLVVIFAGTYYAYNFKQLVALTLELSSSNLASRYGFGGAFDIDAVLQYLHAVFVNPSAIIATFCVVFMLTLGIIKPRKKIEPIATGSQMRTLLYLMLVWFTIPFFIATFGTIKEPRYVYPALVPLFIFAGISIAQYSKSKLATALVMLVFIVPLSGYLYTNNFLSEESVNYKISTAFSFHPESRPDPRDWKVEELVNGIVQNLNAQKEEKNVFFLGGNHFFHMSLLSYECLMRGFHLRFTRLPYYTDPSMTVDGAVKFIADTSPDGIIYKSGENGPAFTSHLDPEIVERLKKDSTYKVVDLGIVLPDGNRFTLFIPSPKKYFAIKSAADLVGNWKAGEGLATIVSSDTGGLILTTETGVQGAIELKDGIIYVPSFTISGKLTDDFQTIQWSNGFIWHRLAGVKTSKTAVKNP